MIRSRTLASAWQHYSLDLLVSHGKRGELAFQDTDSLYYSLSQRQSHKGRIDVKTSHLGLIVLTNRGTHSQWSSKASWLQGVPVNSLRPEFPQLISTCTMCKVAAGPSFGWLHLPNSYQCHSERIQECLHCPLTFFNYFFSRPKQGVIRVLMWIGMPKSSTKPAKEWVWNIFCFLTYFRCWLNLISCLTFPWS